MTKFYIILLLASFQIPKISLGGDSSGSSTKTPIRTLPLVIMTLTDLTSAPKDFETVSWLEEGKIFSGATTFTDNLDKDTEYMCAKKDLSKRLQNNAEELDYCSYPKSFQASDPLYCTYDPEPIVKEMEHKKHYLPSDAPTCGSENRNKMYWFGYEICFTQDSVEEEEVVESESLQSENRLIFKDRFIVYRFCYDEDAKETLYTRHEILSPILLADDRLKQERQRSYDMMTNGYKSFGLHYENIEEAYNKLKNGIENAQQLVPADDMAFATWRKPSYHFLNVKLIRENLKNLWNYISELIRRHAEKDHERYIIYTRTYTTPENKHTTDLSELQQPDIWLKVVDRYHIDSSISKVVFAGIAIVLNNNLGNPHADKFFENACSENLCESAFFNKFPNADKSVRCCSVNKEIKNLFDSRLVVHETLQPDFLFENVNDDPREEKMDG